MNKWIFYRGTNRIREDEVFRAHGLEFKKGKVYPVTDTVYEYVKALRGFDKCSGVGSEEIIDFPPKKTKKPAKGGKE